MRVPHTGCHPGKRVQIILRDGSRFIDQFVSRTDKFVVLKRHGRLKKTDIRAFSIYKA